MTKPCRPNPIRYALFDFDGVIADTEPLYLALDREALRHFGYDPTDAEVASFVGHPSEVAGPALLAEHGIRVTREEFMAAWNPREEIYGSPSLAPSPGLAELWGALADAGIAVGVVSTSYVSDLVQALNGFGLLRHVSVIVGREHVNAHKPAPDPYLRALAWLADADGDATEAARHAIAVEDSPTGIAAARAAGIYTFGYHGAGVAQDTSEANEAVETFAELQGLLLG